jgi:hypothetical protein
MAEPWPEPASGKESRMNQSEKRQPTEKSTEKGESEQFWPLSPINKESCPQDCNLTLPDRPTYLIYVLYTYIMGRGSFYRN